MDKLKGQEVVYEESMKDSLEQLQRFVHSVSEEYLLLESLRARQLELGKGDVAEGSGKKS